VAGREQKRAGRIQPPHRVARYIQRRPAAVLRAQSGFDASLAAMVRAVGKK